MKSEEFAQKLNEKEIIAWSNFIAKIEGILGNPKAPNFEHLVEKLMEDFGNMRCRMSVIA